MRRNSREARTKKIRAATATASVRPAGFRKELGAYLVVCAYLYEEDSESAGPVRHVAAQRKALAQIRGARNADALLRHLPYTARVQVVQERIFVANAPRHSAPPPSLSALGRMSARRSGWFSDTASRSVAKRPS